jgi:hypothetical protein
MRAISVAATAFFLTLTSSCGGGDKALRDATEDDLPRLILQQEDVPDGLQEGTDSCGETAAEEDFELGGASKSYAVEFDVSGLEQRQISCLSSRVGLYRSADDALSYLRGFDAIWFEGEQPAQAPPDIVAEKINVPKLGEYASGLVIKCAECSEAESRIYNIQIQQRNVRSLIMISGGPDDDGLQRAIEYAEKQEERIESVLGTSQ